MQCSCCTLLLHYPDWRTGEPTHRPPFCRLRQNGKVIIQS
jgi:hypothetical protein